MIIHLIHNPICARNFINPIVTFLNKSGIKTELWFEPWEKTKMFISAVDCPKSFAWFDLSFNPLVFFVRLIRLSKRFSRLRPTAIHAYSTRAAFIPLLAAIITRVPVRIYHNLGTPYLGYSGIMGRLLWLLEVLNCKLSTHVLTVSKSIQGRMIADSIVKATKCDVLGEGSACGIDLVEFSSEQFDKQHKVKARELFGIASDAYVVLYVGRPFKRKGFHALLSTWQNMETSDSKSVLLITGCNDNDVINAVGSPIKNVMALGYIKDLRLCYAACDAVVLPSYHEGFPCSLLEGAAAGKPLVGTDIPGIDSIILNNKNGLLVPLDDFKALDEAITTLRDDYDLRKRLGDFGRQYVEQFFDRNIFNKSLLDYYNRLGIESNET